MNLAFTPRFSHHYYRRPRPSWVIDFLPPDDRRTMEIDEAQLEQAVRKATAQLRRSVKSPNPLEDALYSPISGRRVSPSPGRFSADRFSRCHQRN
jgi:hypothetical protein